MRVVIKGLGVALGLAISIGALPARADDPAYLTIGAGSWETFRDPHRNAELDVSYQSSQKLWIFKPQAGLVASKDGDYFGYGGFLVDVYFGPHVVTTLSTAVGLWGGGGFNLGSRVEFRSGGDVAWRFNDASRLGVGFYHISNAGLTQRNPGDESLLLQYSYPLGSVTTASAKAQPAAAAPDTAQTHFIQPAP